jgi:hypothetical protein
MNRIKKIIVHWSASGKYTSVEDIRRWHLKRGWRDIGYHRVILYPGIETKWSELVKQGRALNNDIYLEDFEVGAHTQGFNRDSVAVCVIGNVDYKLHDLQKEALVQTLNTLVYRFKLTKKDVFGHRDFQINECPGSEIYKIVQTYKS